MHTPRDGNWIGSEIKSDDPAELLSLRTAWAKKLIDHCLSADPPITAIAVTDHHDYCIAEVVRSEANGSSLTICGKWAWPSSRMSLASLVGGP